MITDLDVILKRLGASLDLSAGRVADAAQKAMGATDVDERAEALYELTSALLTVGNLNDAEPVARAIEWPAERIEMLVEIALRLVAAGERSRAVGLLSIAEGGVKEIQGDWQRAEALNRNARALAAVGETLHARRLWAEAVDAARVGEQSGSAQDRIDSSSVLAEIAGDLAGASELDEARRVASAIRNEAKRQRALSGLK